MTVHLLSLILWLSYQLLFSQVQEYPLECDLMAPTHKLIQNWNIKDLRCWGRQTINWSQAFNWSPGLFQAFNWSPGLAQEKEV